MRRLQLEWCNVKKVLFGGQTLNEESIGKKFSKSDQAFMEADTVDENTPRTKSQQSCTGTCALVTFLKEQLEDLKAEKEVLKRKLEEATDKLGELQQAKKVKVGDDLTSEQSTASDGVSVPTADGKEIPAGQVHLGDNVFITLKDLAACVEVKTFALRKRVSLTLKLAFPNDYNKRALQDDKVPGSKPISAAQILVMTRLLSKMVQEGDEHKPVTVKQVRQLVSKELHVFRDEAKLNAMSEQEKEALLQKRREKAKAARLAKKGPKVKTGEANVDKCISEEDTE